MKGLRFLATTGSKLPKNYSMMHEPKFPDSYMEIARLTGMDV